ncbi:MAG: glycosyltransferase family 4 protein [Methanofollis sp.]|uniref:glycosyltransferase family 4 protein n=1 Tax=Methanofollis sp. TaxID=2052835 RepID=UPI002623F592|nr:glycosyltransferase family 4 protein [Methanofollis sp.]MDD4254485.1 glycosyltransferase family 4 protein [Methanofollis sp.]
MGKKIVICCNVYPPYFVGGAELIAHAQAKVLHDLGHTVAIFTGDIQARHERHSLRREDYDGLTVYRVCLTSEDYHQGQINFFHKKIEDHFKAFLDEFLPDVVHFHNLIGLSVGLIHIARQKGIRTVLTLHDHWGFCFKNTLLKNDGEICHDYSRCKDCMPFISDTGGMGIPISMRQDFISLQFQDVDALISPSEYLARAYIRAGAPESKFNVVWNGIDVQRFTRIPKTENRGRVRFTFIGYFGRHKGIHVLLDALPFLGDTDRYRVNLVGEGEILEDCKKKVRHLGLKSSVKFWGKIKNIEDAYRETDVLILPSVWPENQPVTITEAMATKIPVIASRLGGTPELVEDGNTGSLFEAGNAQELAQKMLEFISNPDRIQKFGNAGYHKIVPYTLQNQVETLLSIYNAQPSEQAEQPENEVLVACVGRRMDSHCLQAMNVVSRNPRNARYHFVMGDWLQEDHYRRVKVLWVVDPDVDLNAVAVGLMHTVPLLVPENNELLMKVCISGNCGLYYRDALDAEACLEYLAENESDRRVLGCNGFRMHRKGNL